MQIVGLLFMAVAMEKRHAARGQERRDLPAVAVALA